jgi:hypothetical protein
LQRIQCRTFWVQFVQLAIVLPQQAVQNPKLLDAP